MLFFGEVTFGPILYSESERRSTLAEVANHVEHDRGRREATSDPTLIKIRRATYSSVQGNSIEVAVKFQGRVASESPSSSRSAVPRLRKLSWQDCSNPIHLSRYFVPNGATFLCDLNRVRRKGKGETRYVLVARLGLFVVSLLRSLLRLLDGTLSAASSVFFLFFFFFFALHRLLATFYLRKKRRTILQVAATKT